MPSGDNEDETFQSGDSKRLAEERQRDHDDFNDELSGRESGRAPRFFTASERPSGRRAKEEKTERELALFISLAERQSLMARVDEYDEASLRALIDAEERFESKQAELEVLRGNAARDNHGRPVFRTADGSTAFREDKSALSADEFSAIHWRAGQPTWEQWQATTLETDALRNEIDEIRTYRERLAATRERLTDPNAISDEEFAAISKSVEDAPSSVKTFLSARPHSSPVLTDPSSGEANKATNDTLTRLEDEAAAAQITLSAPRP